MGGIDVLGFNAELAMLSYTSLASQAVDGPVRQEIERLGRCIQDGDISRQ